jgi:hypothetical protein
LRDLYVSNPCCSTVCFHFTRPIGASTFWHSNRQGLYAASLGGLELSQALVRARTGKIALNAPLLVQNVVRRHSELELYWRALSGVDRLLGAVGVRRRVHLVLSGGFKPVMSLGKAVGLGRLELRID